MLLVILIIVFLVLFIAKRKIKNFKYPNVTNVSGGVKTGKSTYALYLARKLYKKALFKWKIACLLHPKDKPEKPLFYSNIPVGFDYVPMTREIILRQERLRYKSVAFVDEASLIADSQDWKDENINERLKMFNKLYGHETCGGYLIYNTQTMRDNHYAIKRVMNSYLWIQSNIKWIPFVMVLKVCEMFYSDDGETNAFNKDLDENLKTIIIPKSVWKKFDCYCYSILTDDLPVADKEVHGKYLSNLKTKEIIDLRETQEEKYKKNEARKAELKQIKEKNKNAVPE